MKIFWSWQSDNHQPSGRHFVREVLSALVAELNAEAVTEDAERPEGDGDGDGEGTEGRIQVDHDTLDVGGSPPIADTILRKIGEAAVFVADVTPVGRTKGGKLLPNPNVMIELGYAMKVLEQERILLVMNSAEGAALRHLPFDLRHWRGPVTYTLNRDADERQRAMVARELKDGLRQRIVPSLKLAENRVNEKERETLREPNLSVVLDADEAPSSRRISQFAPELTVDSLDQVKQDTPLLPFHIPSRRIGSISYQSSANDTNIKAYNQDVKKYHLDYEQYLKALSEHELLKLRTFDVKLRLHNTGTSPATSIHVAVTFPEGITLFSHEDDFPEAPAAPEPPEGPAMHSLAQRFLGRTKVQILPPKAFKPLSTNPTTVDPEGRKITFRWKELNHHRFIEFDTFKVAFDKPSDIRSFEAEYVITAREPVDPIKGSILFQIEHVRNG